MAVLYEGVVALEWSTTHGGRYKQLMEIFIEMNWIEREVGETKSSVVYFENLFQ